MLNKKKEFTNYNQNNIDFFLQIYCIFSLFIIILYLLHMNEINKNNASQMYYTKDNN